MNGVEDSDFDPSEFEREERAFRDALADRAGAAPDVPLIGDVTRRNRGWVTSVTAGLAAAAVVLVSFWVVPQLLRDEASDRTLADTTSGLDEFQWKWIGLHALEVRAPAAWDFALEATRPDCIDPNNPHDEWGKDVPTRPYVTVTPVGAVILLIRCTAPRPGNPDPAFGDLPFDLWQPHVRLDVARPDLDQPTGVDGSWTFRGWQLARRTLGDVQVSVLTAPGEPAIAEAVFASARTVETNAVGCDTQSPFGQSPLGSGFPRPTGAPVPAAADVHAIAVCSYSRMEGVAGLEGSWLMDQGQAQALTAAILQSPRGGGPDRPRNCSADTLGDAAVVLRFLGADNKVLADAHVFSQSCRGNGIVDSSGPRELTRATCAPVFSRPEVMYWSGQEPAWRLCARNPR